MSGTNDNPTIEFRYPWFYNDEQHLYYAKSIDIFNDIDSIIYRISVEQIKILISDYNKRKNGCQDCGEEFRSGDQQFKYDGRAYCKSCYEDRRQKCERCGKQEVSAVTHEKYTYETSGGKVVTRILCATCVNLSSCEHGENRSCSFYVENSKESRCKECNMTLCSSHREEHECHIPLNGRYERQFSRTIVPGTVKEDTQIRINRTVGIELEAIGGDPSVVYSLLDKRIGIQHDGSLVGKSPIEVQTPPATTSALEEIIISATGTLRNAHYKVNKSCGMHMHIGVTDLIQNNPNTLFRIMATYYAIEPIIYAMLPLSRRDNRYSLPLDNWISHTKMMELSGKQEVSMKDIEETWYKSRQQQDIETYKKRPYDSSRYHGFNLHSLFKHGTLELRYHHGTLNAIKIRNWVNMHLTILDWVINNYKKSVVNAIYFADNIEGRVRILMRHTKMPKELRRYINRSIVKFSKVEEDQE